MLGGVPVSDEVSEGGVPKFYGDSEGGVSIFYTHKHTQKKKQNKAKYPFRAIPPPPWMPL